MESKSTLPGESTENLKLPPVLIQKELHSLIGTVKKMQVVTTYEEVLEGLKLYVWEKKLFDPCNPFKVCCKDDALSTVLGAEEFTVFDVKTFLQKLVTPVNKINKDSPEATSQSVSDNSSKRKLDESFESDQKKVCTADGLHQPTSPMILHIPPSPEKCDSSESTNSIQGYETAFVNDSVDDFTSTADSDDFFSNEGRIIAVEETFDLEYEVETDCSDDDDGFLPITSSDSEAEIAAEVALDAAILSFVCRTDSDTEFFADGSSDEDAEIPKSDDWKCRSCYSKNRATVGSCYKCFKQRSGWLPEKGEQSELASPPRRRRKQRKSRGSAVRSSSREISEKDEASFSKSYQDSQGSSCPDVSPETKENSLLPAADASLVAEPSQKLCIICCERPANASIIHAKYAHQISCYKCARKLQKQKKRCPVCRRTIDRVVYQISSV